mmetsp:Transcript_10280/g.22877  ORF Transcript_10280/g.22877 Transcript_10280/m.22877 type:complete len:96 (-) Transcript_10280:248-535(-)
MLTLHPSGHYPRVSMNSLPSGMESFQCQLVDMKFIYAHLINLEPATPISSSFFTTSYLLLIEKCMKSLVERGCAKAFCIEKFILQQCHGVIVPCG